MAAEGKKMIVAVDDDPTILELLRSSFKAKGFEVKTFGNGTEAKNFLSNESNVNGICLLILDRLLPDSEGLEILSTFIEKYKDKVPILILSSLSSEQDVVEGLRKGAVEYLTKPFSMEVLMHKALPLIEHQKSS